MRTTLVEAPAQPHSDGAAVDMSAAAAMPAACYPAANSAAKPGKPVTSGLRRQAAVGETDLLYENHAIGPLAAS